MIGELLPDSVATAWRGDDSEPVRLFPEEAAAIARAVVARRREFATVRLCARLALGRLGLPEVPLTPGERGAPKWPEGVVGSMTHCDGYRAAALGRSTELHSLGIDAEPAAPLPDGVLEAVSLAEERRGLAALTGRRMSGAAGTAGRTGAAGASGVPWDRLLFSAKESVYKAWYPLAGRFLDFTEAVVEFEPDAGTFTARLLVPGPVVAGRRLDGFSGRWQVRNGLVLTAVVVPR